MDRRIIILRIALFLMIVLVWAFFWWKQSSESDSESGEDTMLVREPRIVDPFRDLPDALAEAMHISPVGHENICFSRAYTLLDFELGMPLGSVERDLKTVALGKLRDPKSSRMDRARACLIMRKFEEAEALALQARDEARRKGVDGTRDVVLAIELAGLAAEKAWPGGRFPYPKALEYYQAAAALTSKDRDFLEWVRMRNHLGRVLERLGRNKEAEKLLTATIKEAKSRTPPLANHELLLRTRCLLAMMQMILKKYPESEKTCRAVLQVNELGLGPEHPVTLQNRFALGTALTWMRDREEEGDRIHQEVYQARKRLLGPDHVDTLLSQMGEARKFRRLQRNDLAAIEYRAVAEARDRTVGPLAPEARSAWSSLSNLYYNDDKFAECETIERVQLPLQEKAFGFGDHDTLNSSYMLMRALQQQNKLEEARTLARRAVVAAKRFLDEKDSLRSKIFETAEDLEQ